MATAAPPVDSRTLMASVVCADLVGFSKKNVADQISIKERLARHLQAELTPLAPGERVVMDTGDGVAVAFLADPEHALYFALRLRLDLRRNRVEGLRSEDLRLGINLGPVKKVVDINGYANLLGEGMNSAERIMSFAQPGDTTASRSFRDAVWCLRADYESMFEPLGRHTDKHGREHEVFRMLATAAAAKSAELSLDGPASVAQGVPAAPVEPPATGSWRRASLLWIGAATAAAAVGGAAWIARAPEPARAEAAPVETRPIGAAPLEALPAPVAAVLDPPFALTEASGPAATIARPPSRKVERPAPTIAASPQCSLLLQRAAVGEKMRAAELEELKTCR